MKRSHAESAVKRHYPLFMWTQCECCKKDFRREWGWRTMYVKRSIYLCKDCAPTVADVVKVINKLTAGNFSR